MLQSSPTTAASHNPCYQREVIPQNPTLPGSWLTLVVEQNRLDSLVGGRIKEIAWKT
jgi:hypothetical protein